MSQKINFEEVRKACFIQDRLYEDPNFPAVGPSIDPDGDDPGNWIWKRPKELCTYPRFVLDRRGKFDYIQGESDDWWFVSAAAVLATRPELFVKVVPADQKFTGEYAGIFRFNIWRFGKFEEVIVDDRLPVTLDDKLRFAQNRSTPHEFWLALLEKAYAKLHGSYKGIKNGQLRDGLVDLTGSISESVDLRKEEEVPPALFDILLKSYKMGSLCTCSIVNESGSMREEQLWNGLYKGHAYYINKIIETRIAGWNVKLLRLLNPWGQTEWTGAWSDGSPEWHEMTNADRQELGMDLDEDFEFWMSFDDWTKAFHFCDILHQTSDALCNGPQEESDALVPVPLRCMRWYETTHHGTWVRGINAGGSGLMSPDKEIYYTNPQYHMSIMDPDIDDISHECTCLISLTQKQGRRRKNNPTGKKLIIGFDVHQFKGKRPREQLLQSENYFDLAKLKKQFHPRKAQREVTCRLQVDPGVYCIVPNTMKSNVDGDFVLRIFTYAHVDSSSLNLDVTGPLIRGIQKPIERPMGNIPSELFWNYAEEDRVVDARDLRDIIGVLSRRELKEPFSFGLEACRCLISWVDKEESGVLDFNDLMKLWDDVLFWWKLFKKYDQDQAGCIEPYQLRKMFLDLDFGLHMDTISLLAVRYGGKERVLFFEDCILCICRIMSMYRSFQKYKQGNNSDATLNLHQWMKTTLYL